MNSFLMKKKKERGQLPPGYVALPRQAAACLLPLEPAAPGWISRRKGRGCL